jgi:hypothetical protein
MTHLCLSSTHYYYSVVVTYVSEWVDIISYLDLIIKCISKILSIFYLFYVYVRIVLHKVFILNQYSFVHFFLFDILGQNSTNVNDTTTVTVASTTTNSS